MNFTMYNIMSGVGFEGKQMQWSMCWFAAPLLFFICVFANKYLPEFGVQWNSVFAFIGTFTGFLIAVTLSGLPGPALIAGIIGMGLGGYLGGMIAGE